MIPQYSGPKGLKLEQSEVNVDLKDFTGSPPLTGTLAFEGASKENVQELNEQEEMMEDEFSGFRKRNTLSHLKTLKYRQKMEFNVHSEKMERENAQSHSKQKPKKIK